MSRPSTRPALLPGDKVLRFIERDMLHAHEEEVGFQHRVRFPGEAADVHGNRLQETKGILGADDDQFLIGGSLKRSRGCREKQG